MISITKLSFRQTSICRSIYSLAFEKNRISSRFRTTIYPSTSSWKKNLSSNSSDTQSQIPKQDLRGWINAVFPDRKVRKVFTPGTIDKREGSIIPNPKEDMDIPLLNIDLSAIINDIFKQLSVPPSPTSKYVFATVRGQGGGKSRLLEEIRRKCLDIPTTLPIAITCNGYSGLLMDEKAWMTKKGLDKESAYAMSIISRMIFSIYDIEDFKTVTLRILKNLNTFPAISSRTIISELIPIIVDDVSVVRGGVTDVVVIMGASRLLGYHFGNSDIHEILRDAILNDHISNLRCTVVMSSLDVNQIGYRDSGRGISSLPLPERLNEDEVVDKIFNRGGGVVLPERDRLKLKLIASLLSNLPRTVQFALNYIIANPINVIDTAFVKNIFKHILRNVSSRFQAFLPSDEMIFRIVFDLEVPLNEETKNLINESILTNVIDQFTETPYPIFPTASLLMLASAAEKDSHKVLAKYITKSFEAILDSIEKTNKEEGDIIKDIFQIWLQLRLQCAFQWGCINRSTTLTMAQLFGSTFLSNEGGIWNLPIKFPPGFNSLHIVATMKTLSYIQPFDETTPGGLATTHFEVWLQELLHLAPVSSKDTPNLLIRLANNEYADFCMVIDRGGDSKPFLAFVQLESSSDKKDDSKESTTKSDSVEKADQYFIKNLRENMTEKDFAFLSFTAQHFNFDISETGIINLGTISVKSFFSIIWPLYLVGR